MADKIPGVPLKMPIRYVIFSKERGVYLGQEKWSKADFASSQTAPTFNKEQAGRLLATTGKMIEAVPDATTYEVVPDKPGFLATQDAIANAGLPRWNDKDTPNGGVVATTADPTPLAGTQAHKDGQNKVRVSTPESRKKEREAAKETRHSKKGKKK